jgi:hypothetical protein
MKTIKILIEEGKGDYEYNYLMIESKEDWEDMWGGKWMDMSRK